MKRKIGGILGCCLALGLVLSASLTWAEVTLIPITGSQLSVADHPMNDPGTVWTDDNGITHIRNKVHWSVAEGTDDQGNVWTAEGYVRNNVNLNMATGEGDMSGYIHRYYTYLGREGYFSGRINAKSTNYVWIGKGTYPHTTGDFVGWKKVKVNFTRAWPSPIAYMEGFFKVPPGEDLDKSLTEGELTTWDAVRAMYRE